MGGKFRLLWPIKAVSDVVYTASMEDQFVKGIENAFEGFRTAPHAIRKKKHKTYPEPTSRTILYVITQR